MFQPSFNNGSILKQNMLEAVRDYPHAALEVFYSNYGDGILSGFEISPVDKEFRITPGILKVDGKIYVTPESIAIEQKNGKYYVYLTVQHTDVPDGTDVDLECRQASDPDENGFELFRYIKNAEMHEYKNIDEAFKDPMNRIDRRACQFAVIGGSTLCPNYYRLFAKEILKCANAAPSDAAFAYQCLNGINHIEAINQYFNGSTTNSEILKKMKTALDMLRKGSNVRETEKLEAPKKMIID